MEEFFLMLFDEDMSLLDPLPTIEDDYDDLLQIFTEERVRPKNENYISHTVSKYDEQEFKEHFRLTKGVATHLSERYAGSNFFHHQSGGNGKLSAYEQTLIFLWFCGHQTSSFRDVADRFNITISCLFRVNVRMTYFVSSMAEEVIRWPSRQEQTTIEAAFNAKGFPGVIGAVDGTHIRLDKPSVDPDSYCNRKKYFSVHMQGVCDHRAKLRSIFIGFPGSVHDARVYGCSDFGQNIQEMCGNNIVLGDSAYPCSRNLITPFKDFGRLTRGQKAFNKILSSCRSIIEHSFGMLKQRFRQLYHCKLRNMHNITHFIRACCVLHNIAIDNDPDFSFFEPHLAEEDSQEEEEDHDVAADSARDTLDGVAYRNYLVNVLGH